MASNPRRRPSGSWQVHYWDGGTQRSRTFFTWQDAVIFKCECEVANPDDRLAVWNRVFRYLRDGWGLYPPAPERVRATQPAGKFADDPETLPLARELYAVASQTIRDLEAPRLQAFDDWLKAENDAFMARMVSRRAKRERRDPDR